MRYFTFSWGRNYIAVRALLRVLGHELATPPSITTPVIERGIAAAHPFLCFSGKLVLGQLQTQLEEGEHHMAFMSSLGPEACRCADTSEYLESLFGKMCPTFSAHRIGGDGIGTALGNLRSHFGPRITRAQCMRAYAMFFGKVDVLDKIERRCLTLFHQCRNPERVRILEAEAVRRVDHAHGMLSLWRVSRWFDNAAASLPKRTEPPLARIGIVGGEHILSELDSILMRLKRLAEEGIRLDWQGGFRCLARSNEERLAPLKERCRDYIISTDVSTSEIFSCAHALDFVDKGYDGLLHIYAFGCMPQTAAKPILQRIAQDAGVPMLSLAIGDRFAEEGLDNRVEAFVDLLQSRRMTTKVAMP
jgi:hypothetical protein